MSLRFAWIVTKYVLGLGLLVWMVYRYWHIPAQDGSEMGISGLLSRRIEVLPIIWALLLSMAAMIVTFVRWYVLVRSQNLPFTLIEALRLGMIGLYLSTFLPGSVGGDVIKAAFLARQQQRRTVAVATVVVDRIVGLCGMFFLVVILGGIFFPIDGLGSQPNVQRLFSSILQGACVLVLAILVASFALLFAPARAFQAVVDGLERIPKVGPPLAEVARAVWMYRDRSGSVWLAMGLSMVSHSMLVTAFYCCADSLLDAEQFPSLPVHFLIIPVGMIVQAGFPAPGGMGGAEYAYGFLYEQAGSYAASGLSASLMGRCLLWVIALIGFLVYSCTKPAKAPESGAT